MDKPWFNLMEPLGCPDCKRSMETNGVFWTCKVCDERWEPIVDRENGLRRVE